MKIAIGIASAGRRDVLAETIAFLNNQTRIADELIICPAKPEDLDENRIKEYVGISRIVSGPLGSAHQRNAIMRNCDADIIIFFDDDYLPSVNFIQETEKLFNKNNNIASLTGYVIADGINGSGLTFDEAVQHINNDKGNENLPETITKTYSAYGCNMVINARLAREHDIWFDENLPLYAWLEDVDFCARLGKFGETIRSNKIRGVHMGTKRSGRSPGKRLGYSQIANPIYMVKKGSMPFNLAFKHIWRNIAANLGKSFFPEPWVDRKGRLAGNLIAIGDLIFGKIRPNRILDKEFL